MGAFTCIRSDPVEPVDPEKALVGSGQLSVYLHLQLPPLISIIVRNESRARGEEWPFANGAHLA